MKTRKGFVSNSSSSSFIIVMDKKDVPKSVDDLKKKMFNETKTVSYWDKSYSTDELARTVFNDMERHGKTRIDDKELQNLVIQHGENVMDALIYKTTWQSDDEEKWFKENFDCDSYEARWEYRSYLATVIGIKEYQKFRKDNSGRSVFILEYADDGGQEVYEHGGLFDNFDGMRISHH